ncbi:MAG: crossover junction endodeoxyribonuclease RuvC [Candidatus Shapirobacteria bacterium]
MKILGIDPGTATTGFGVIEASPKLEFKVINFGWISTPKEQERNKRLKSIYKQMTGLLEKQMPEVMAIEQLLFYNNQKTAMRVSEAIGVIRLAAVEKKINIVEYSPPKIKSVIAKNGRAKKEEMKKAVRKILSIRSPNKKKTHFDDVADALGIAVCHAKIIYEICP